MVKFPEFLGRPSQTGVGGQHHILAALPPGTHWRLDGAHRRYGRFSEEKKIACYYWDLNPGPSTP
jgi:hypothetical protein